MKHLLKIVLLCFISTGLQAQSEQEQAYFKEDYSDTFKNESVVITRLFEEYTFTNAGGPDYKINVVYRAQYKLKDISALEAFSTLSKNRDLKRYVLKQIKPDGKTNLIYEYYDKSYPDDGYDDDEEEEEGKAKEKEEIPLENLEIGDIIDYQFEYTYTTKTKDFEKVYLSNGRYEKKPTNVQNFNKYKYLPYKTRLLEEQYPIASGLIIYNVPKELGMVQKSLNCNFTFVPRTEGNRTLYVCRMTNLTAFKKEDYSYSYLHHPVIKYSLVQTDQQKALFYPFQFTAGKTSNEDIAALGRKFYRDKQYLPKYVYYVNTAKYPEGYVQVATDKFLKSFLKTFTKKDKDKLVKLNKFHEYLTNNDELNDNMFSDMSYAVLMAKFCDEIKLPYSMMACMPRYDGKMDDVISPYDITWGIYVPNKKGDDVFVTSYGEESNIYERFGSLSGTNVILFNPKNDDAPKLMPYPADDFRKNTIRYHSDAVLSDDKAFEYKFLNTYAYSGQQKYAISDEISHQFRHVDLYTPAPFMGMVNGNDIYSSEISYKTTYDAFMNYIKESHRLDSCWGLIVEDYQKRQMQSFLYNEYHFRHIEIDSFKVFNRGNFEDNDTATYGFKIDFKVNGVLDKTSSDSMMVMNLGKLITEQYQLSNYKVNERLGDVYNSSLRELTWDISIELPKNYKCMNLSEFNQAFENEAGIFKTEVSEVDGKIVMKVTKIYKSNYMPKEKWVEMVDHLHHAASYYNKKLLLEKK